MFVFDMLSCMIIAALWSPAGDRADLLTLSYVVFSCVSLLSHMRHDPHQNSGVRLVPLNMFKPSSNCFY